MVSFITQEIANIFYKKKSFSELKRLQKLEILYLRLLYYRRRLRNRPSCISKASVSSLLENVYTVVGASFTVPHKNFVLRKYTNHLSKDILYTKLVEVQHMISWILSYLHITPFQKRTKS